MTIENKIDELKKELEVHHQHVVEYSTRMEFHEKQIRNLICEINNLEEEKELLDQGM